MGSIRKVTKSVKGKEYTYYEARYTVGFDPGTGKQIQRSVTDKSKKIVAQKLKAAIAAIDAGIYKAPCNKQLPTIISVITPLMPVNCQRWLSRRSSH